MKYRSHNAKRDSNEPEIVKALQRVGAEVIRLDTPADLLVGFRGKNYLIEVKLPLGVNGGENGSTLTEDQKRFTKVWQGQYCVVRTTDEALKAIGL